MSRLSRFLIFIFVNGIIGVASMEGNIAWIFQQPTYLLEKDTAGLTSYICDPDKDACKVNLDFTSSIPADEPSTHYACLLDFGFGITGEEATCNPNTVEFPIGTWDVRLTVTKISDSIIVAQGALQIIHPDNSIDPARVSQTLEWQSPTYLLGKEDISLLEYSCDPEESECKINPKITTLIDGVYSSRLTCEITSDFDLTATSDPCNPNTSIVPVGDHLITIKILEKSTSNILQTQEIILKNPQIDTSIDPTRVITDIVFQQPTYLIEKNDVTLSSYTCESGRECKVNLQIIPKLDGAESSRLACRVTTDFGLEFLDCNPSDFMIPAGSHSITIETLQKETNIVLGNRKIDIIAPEPVQTGGGGGSTQPASSTGTSVNQMNLETTQITVQSGLDTNFVCKTDICQVNFDAVVPTGAVCRWDFGAGVFDTAGTDTKCNPGYVRFAADTTVRLTITDPGYPDNTTTRDVAIFRTANPTVVTQLVPSITLQGKIGSNKRLTSTGIICELGKNEFCSLNFTGAESIGAKTYSWDFGNGQYASDKNPTAMRYALGTYRVRLTVNGISASSSTYFDIQIVQKMDDELIKKCETDCPDLTGKIVISSVLPNPPRADTVEWIEVKNISEDVLYLDGCSISDESKTYDLSGTLGAGKTLRLRQFFTKISLGNTSDSLNLTCNDVIIDTFLWDFSIPSGYILRREVLQNTPKTGKVITVIDGDTIDMLIDDKKTRVRLLGIDTPETVHPRKPVEAFGKQASEYTKYTLEGKPVWITYDQEPIDHYGRTLGYIWICPTVFIESECTLFNAQIVTRGLARMERRFPFIRYDVFDDLEKTAKDQKIGVWSDPEVAKTLNEMSSNEKEALTTEQEKEYLELQKELLELEPLLCDPETEKCEELPTWLDITEKFTTFSVTAKKSGTVTVLGRTWPDSPVQIRVKKGDKILQTFDLQTDAIGEFRRDWTPLATGEYLFQFSIREPAPPASLTDEESSSLIENIPGILIIEKTLSVEMLSENLSTPLTAEVIVQGTMSANRWREGDTFHCRSRGSCSINLTATTNRSSGVSYFWHLPSGDFAGKNPPAFKVGYGRSGATLEIIDEISGEKKILSLEIQHSPIPKKASTKTSKSQKFTLDIKDVPQDRGGGVGQDDPPNPLSMGMGMIVLLLGAGLLFQKR